MVSHLSPAEGASAQVVVDERSLMVVDGIEGIDAEKLLDSQVFLNLHHQVLTPAASSDTFSRFNPDRIRLFIVPSGSPSMSATSR